VVIDLPDARLAHKESQWPGGDILVTKRSGVTIRALFSSFTRARRTVPSSRQRAARMLQLLQQRTALLVFDGMQNDGDG
jgi:hypothetical protein